MRARLDGQHDRHLDDAVRDPAVHTSPPRRGRLATGRRGYIVHRLRLAVVDLEREPERARVAQTVQRRRDVRLDRDAPALVTSVEQVEVVLADGSGVSETWVMHEQQ